ncbi:polymorphic membrane protein repeat-containing protein [Dictyostelium discoideum AX4]|uniref:Polymorphic membrane protein repeat-containing protein n=1 Tax=Dictyostelium discoideum TaxID=44689 RepID=Q54WL1_DICDI|nr:polymorphic membrane protein repeat-containing protein [Dictyostelium discoideum AX4]EAL67724.1 polymorphic membrane protein repeat-containing protein [Dictyostelium discoideum AX4]|eukprot:XP_641706.1 polymorphic membrane protein repeat-containing protein [Dictyostelium discoideum AX4]
MYKLIIALLFLYVYIFGDNIVLGGEQCISYTDSKSGLTENCGTAAATPCQSISQSILSCGGQFESITMNIEPGTYLINQATFGKVTNQSITLVNNNKETNDVIIDLSNATDSFIRIEPSSIYDTSIVSFTGITFQNGNKPYGPVLFNNGTSNIQLEINNCVFNNNNATIGGGSIAIDSTDGESDYPPANSVINISKTTFNNSTSSKISGGVLYAFDLNVVITIDQCSFSNIRNSASGGIIYMRNGLLTMTNSKLDSIASNAAFFLASEFLTTPQFKFTNVNFTNALGGIGFAFTNYFTKTYFLNCNFVNNLNTAPIFGLNSGLITVDSCLFANNNNQKSPGSSGGAISLTATECLVKNSIFTNNFAQNGGAININSSNYAFLDTPTTIIGSQFINNTAAVSGGAIDIYSSSITINSTSFIGNYAKQDDHGPSVYCTNSKINLSSTTFKINETNTVNSFGIDCLPSVSYFCTVINQSKKLQCEKDDFEISSDNTNGLTTGQKVGISFGVIGGFFLIVIVAVLVVRKVKRDRQYKPIGL